MSPIVSQRLISILNKEHFSGLDRLAKLAATEAVTPRIEQSYSLAEVPDAVRQLKAGKVRGQIVITPASKAPDQTAGARPKTQEAS